MNHWIDPNMNMLRMRITEKKYADAFIKNGSIKFNTPDDWAKYELQHGQGRGDMYEGAFAFCAYDDIKKFKELNDCYSNPLNIRYKSYKCKIYKQKILFKDNRSVMLPCFCLYVLKVTDFEIPSCEGRQTLRSVVSKSYFMDFVDNRSENEIKSLSEEESPYIIVISDFSEFLERLKSNLMEIGVKEEEILLHYVSYKDHDKFGERSWGCGSMVNPKELFLKSKRYSEQKECRIVINSRDNDILKKFKRPIELGDMSDISQIAHGYHPGGIAVEFNVDVYTDEKA